MKTRRTTLFVVLLLLVGFSVNANQQNSKINRLRFLQQQKASLLKEINSADLKRLSFANNQFSVPGNSGDYTWDPETNSWMLTSITTYTYDETGNLLDEIVQDAESYLYLTRESQKYDNKGNITEEISYIRGDEEWIILSGVKTLYSYDDHGNLTEEIEQIWNDGIWENKSKHYYTLNGSGIPTEFHESVWDGAAWVDYSRTILLVWHDWAKKQLAGYTVQYWQDGMKDERYTAVYEGDSYTGTTEVQENGGWVNSKRETYIHSSTEVATISETWENSAWKKGEKFVSTFDTSGNPTGFQYSSWGGNDWFLEIRYYFDLVYDDMNNLTEMTVRYWDPELETPENVLKSVFSNFLYFTTDVPEISVLNNVKVFPNPVENALNISISDASVNSYQLNISNLAGQTVYQDAFSNSFVAINTEKIPRGVYVLSIRAKDGKTHQTKVFKQ